MLDYSVPICRLNFQVNPEVRTAEIVGEAGQPVEGHDSMLPRKTSKREPDRPYHKPTQVGGVNNLRRSR